MALVFPQGIFHGKEVQLRISEDKKWVSAYDFIKLVGGQTDPYKTWSRIEIERKDEVQSFCLNLKFPGSGQKLTPVINAKGVIQLLMWIPGETAKKFRSEAADILVRYLGGDTTLINEIQGINTMHKENPENILSPFRNYVNEQMKWVPSQMEINLHKSLLEYYGNDNNLLYFILVTVINNPGLFVKFGIISSLETRNLFKRIKEHAAEFESMALFHVLKTTNSEICEQNFKKLSIIKLNQEKIRSNTQNQTEILKTETLTTEQIKHLSYEAAGDLAIDPPPQYSSVRYQENDLDIEREKTKQIQEQEKTKQIQEQEKTKQKIQELEQERTKQLEIQERAKIELKKIELEFELKKLELEVVRTLPEQLEVVRALPGQRLVRASPPKGDLLELETKQKLSNSQIGANEDSNIISVQEVLPSITQQNQDVKTENIENTSEDESDTNANKSNKNYLQQRPKISGNGNYKGCCFDTTRHKWRAYLGFGGKTNNLGSYDTEIEAAKAYNDYALFVNQTFDTKYFINEIEGYIPNIRDVAKEKERTAASQYFGVFPKTDNTNGFMARIGFQNNALFLGSGSERECAILFNKQALHFNNNFGTNYKLNRIDNYIDVAEDIYGKRQISKESSYIGVIRRGIRFCAVVKYKENDKIAKKHIGTFATKDEAAEAYNKYVIANKINKRLNKI